MEEEPAVDDVMPGIISITDVRCKVLFHTGASHSFISRSFAKTYVWCHKFFVRLDRVVGGEKTPIFCVSSVLCVKRTPKTDSVCENSQNLLFSDEIGLTGSFRSRAGSRPTGVHQV